MPVVRRLLRWGADVNEVGAEGYTPLMHAVHNGASVVPPPPPPPCHAPHPPPTGSATRRGTRALLSGAWMTCSWPVLTRVCVLTGHEALVGYLLERCPPPGLQETPSNIMLLRQERHTLAERLRRRLARVDAKARVEAEAAGAHAEEVSVGRVFGRQVVTCPCALVPLCPCAWVNGS